jgi:hypothetical protein
MFMSDPRIDKVDAKHLIQEIASSIRKLSKDRFVIVSFAHCHSQYEGSVLPAFNTCTQIIENPDNNQILQIRVRNSQNKKRGFSGSRAITLNKRELMLVSHSDEPIAI